MSNLERVLDLHTVDELRNLEPSSFKEKDGWIKQGEIEHIFKLCNALWLHSGDPKDPHVELTSGNCSNGFIDTLRVLRYSNLCHLFGHQIVEMIGVEQTGFDTTWIDWVIGSDHAGAALSHSVAYWLDAQHDFTEKGPDKSQTWKRFPIQPKEFVLQVEELVTTTGTLKAVRKGIREGSPDCRPVRFTPFVVSLIHRSSESEIEDDPIKYLAHFDIDTWSPEVCPLCAAGSKKVRPKQIWDEFTGKA